VRRLLKNDNQAKKVKLSTHEMRGKLSEMIANSPTIAHNAHNLSEPRSPGLQGSFLASNTLSNYSGVGGREVPYHERQMRLFEEIKMEIKEELRRQKERVGVVSTGVREAGKGKGVSEVKYRERIRSTNVNCLNLNVNGSHHKHKSDMLNRVPSKTSIGKTQLPVLNSHILIITSNSSKGLAHGD
jgi:hypothetical protein